MRNLLFLLLVFSSLFSFSQIVEETIQIDTNSITIKVIYKTPTTGYYFKKIAVYANDTNQIAIEKTFTSYGQNGLFEAFYPSGKPMIRTVYANNKIHGDWTWYQENGAIKVKGKYKEGIKHLYWAYKYTKSYGRYKKGLKNGRWIQKDVNGVKHVAYYKKGKLTRGERHFFKNVIVKPTSPKDSTKIISIPPNYQLVITHLKENYLLRKKFKYYYTAKKKERKALDKHFNYTKDYFKFRLSPVQIPLDLKVFIAELQQGKTENSVIDSVLQTEAIKTSYQKSLSSNKHSIQTNNSFFEYSTEKDAEVIIYLSKIENNLIKAEIFKCVLPAKEIDYEQFYLDNNCKKFSILYYLNEGNIRGVAYEKPQ